MSSIQNMNVVFRIDASDFASSENAIQNLMKFSQINVPIEFIEIISELTEVEISVNNEMYIRIWGAENCIEMNEAYNIQKYIPNSLAIGDDEGGNALIYANGPRGYGLYLISFNDLEVEEMKFISSSLFDLLHNATGIDVILSP